MNGKYWTIKEAATVLGVSEKTIRRRIKDGTIKAEQADGKYGAEYHITDLDGMHVQPLDRRQDDGENAVAYRDLPAEQAVAMDKALEMIRALQSEIERLSGQVGFLQAQLVQAEKKIKLLSAPKRPWWYRLAFWKREQV